jgi:hypothetical protein
MRWISCEERKSQTDAEDCGDGRENVSTLFHGVRFLLSTGQNKRRRPATPELQAAN